MAPRRSQREFARRLLDWQPAHGRHGLPWQATRDPYRVWLSEIMLQQTQVATVLPYYDRFLARYADVRALADAPLDQVMALWAGLGYYSRARNLHACARAVVREHDGQFPRTAAALARLPGIGRSTAAAIAAFCFAERAAILDGNVRRVLARHRGLTEPLDDAAGTRRLWSIAEGLLPAATEMPRYTQAIMDLGATICVRGEPRCGACPVAADCVGRASGNAARLPAVRRRAAVRVRAAAMLLVRARDQVLLERRPGAGIWGGLLALPEFPTAAGALALAAQLAPGVPVRALPPRRHAFTHFTLDFTAHLLDLTHLPAQLGEPTRQWWPLDRLADAALPAPLRSLLTDLANGAAAPTGLPAALRAAGSALRSGRAR